MGVTTKGVVCWSAERVRMGTWKRGREDKNKKGFSRNLKETVNKIKTIKSIKKICVTTRTVIKDGNEGKGKGMANAYGGGICLNLVNSNGRS